MQTTLQLRDKTQIIKAYKSDSPFVIIHKSINGLGWSVTHAPSSYSMFDNIKLLKTAKIVASLVSTIDGLGDIDPTKTESLGPWFKSHYDFLRDIRDFARDVGPKPTVK